ncbi:hypothetical protein [Streptomyces sp. NPDC046859]|uniref:hypothetical protein n=1 Tax=Streptomyces sp. NPDC046859 TaxID=3155734 RepID=UPI0033DAD759
MREDELTIGAFARACRLSPKALRLYDELRLLRPRGLLASADGPDDAVRALIGAANDAGGPDNVSCVVADVVDRAA